MPKIMTIAAALLAAPAAAQPPAPPAPPPIVANPADPAAIVAARALLIESGAEQQMEETGQRMATATFDTLIKESEKELGHPVPPDLLETLKAVVARHTERLVVELKATIIDDGAKIYARYFTAAEIEELRRLQSNPVMIKFRKIAPSFLTETMQLGVAVAARHQPELKADIEAATETWLHKHQPLEKGRHS